MIYTLRIGQGKNTGTTDMCRFSLYRYRSSLFNSDLNAQMFDSLPARKYLEWLFDWLSSKKGPPDGWRGSYAAIQSTIVRKIRCQVRCWESQPRVDDAVWGSECVGGCVPGRGAWRMRTTTPSYLHTCFAIVHTWSKKYNPFYLYIYIYNTKSSNESFPPKHPYNECRSEAHIASRKGCIKIE